MDSLSGYLDKMPWYYPSPEVYIKSSDKQKFKHVDELKKILKKKGYRINTIDGVRVDFRNGWALARASNTTPHIKCRFEGRTEKDLKEIISIMRPLMRKAGFRKCV